jgi:hypothetical protein
MKLDHAIALSLFTVYTGKLLVLGANPSDAVIVVTLAALYAANRYFDFSKEYAKLEDKLEVQANELAAQKDSIEYIKASVASAKIAQGFRPAK